MILKTRIASAALGAVLLVAVPAANATITWDWLFGGEAGTFVTDGSILGPSNAPPGTYVLQDFTVDTSPAGESIGSLSGGQYVALGFETTLPYSFDWSGAAVILWHKTDTNGSNRFNWWVFHSAATPTDYYLFGDTNMNVNDATQAALYHQSDNTVPAHGTVKVSVAGAVPEPATGTLMFLGLGSLGAVARGRRRSGLRPA